MRIRIDYITRRRCLSSVAHDIRLGSGQVGNGGREFFKLP